jgi:transcriptional regulator with GAF, ATPase, and Fis domain
VTPHPAPANSNSRAPMTVLVDLLDGLLDPSIDLRDLPRVLGRLSTLARRALPHDALALVIAPADGHSPYVHATCGFPAAARDLSAALLELEDDARDEGEPAIHGNLTRAPLAGCLRLACMGFHSLLRLPLTCDGVHAGALLAFSTTHAAFTRDDIDPARAIADRLTSAIARGREIEAVCARATDAMARASQLDARVRALSEELDARTGFRRVVGESPAWQKVLTQATQAAPTGSTVLLLGQSGTGKEVVARFLHRASTRRDAPFVAINCAALPEQLLEAELFGYERGAFTGAAQSKPGQLELAAGGTLFLDEVGEMSPSAQAKFLRVLQEREFQRLGGTRVLRADVRIIAATNRDLPTAIDKGGFREDLYYRLNVFAIQLPPLCERREDILPLSQAFLGELAHTLGRPPAGISRDARQLLLNYHWPGNVRELRNSLERASILCDGGLITAEHLALTAAAPLVRESAAAAQVEARAPQAATTASVTEAQPSSAHDLQAIERAMIERALTSVRYNKSRAARALGLTRRQLYNRLEKYGIA